MFEHKCAHLKVFGARLKQHAELEKAVEKVALIGGTKEDEGRRNNKQPSSWRDVEKVLIRPQEGIYEWVDPGTEGLCVFLLHAESGSVSLFDLLHPCVRFQSVLAPPSP